MTKFNISLVIDVLVRKIEKYLQEFTAVDVFRPFVGQASSENAKAVGMLAESMAKTGWKLASKGTGPNSDTGGGGLGGTKRMYSTSSHVGTSGKLAQAMFLNGCKVQMKLTVLNVEKVVRSELQR